MTRVHYAIFGCLISAMLLIGSAKAVKPAPHSDVTVLAADR